MKPFPVMISQDVCFLIIPDAVGHMDGHPVLTYSYSIFKKDNSDDPEEIFKREAKLYLKTNDDPDYCGVILFEQPGKFFSYQPGMYKSVNATEVEEIIEQITKYRDNPKMWML